jgi:RimJ/RimL family protein N-acetyltransferase
MKIPTLTTPRLILRPFTEQDVDPLHRMLLEEGVLRYFPNPEPPSRERIQQMVSNLLRHWAEQGSGLWAVTSRSTGELMGRTGLMVVPGTEEVEIDFLYGKPFWNQGFATEGGRASLQYGFETLELEQIIGVVHPENMASRRVLEKLGLKFTEPRQYFGMDCYRYLIERSGYKPQVEAPINEP